MEGGSASPPVSQQQSSRNRQQGLELPDWIVNEGVHSKAAWGPPQPYRVNLDFDWHLFTGCLIVIDTLSLVVILAGFADFARGVRVRWLSPANRVMFALLFGFAKTMSAWMVVGKAGIYYSSLLNLTISMVFSWAALAYNDGTCDRYTYIYL